MRLFLCFCLFSQLLVLTSCDPQRVYENNINIPGDSWSQNRIIKFDVEVKDTISTHNIYVNVRNTGEYPMSNLYIFIKTTSPLGYSVKDTFECILADDRGKWTGKGFGSIWSNQCLFKENIRFPFTGIYSFEYEQAMRIGDLTGLTDVGLRLEKNK